MCGAYATHKHGCARGCAHAHTRTGPNPQMSPRREHMKMWWPAKGFCGWMFQKTKRALRRRKIGGKIKLRTPQSLKVLGVRRSRPTYSIRLRISSSKTSSLRTRPSKSTIFLAIRSGLKSPTLRSEKPSVAAKRQLSWCCRDCRSTIANPPGWNRSTDAWTPEASHPQHSSPFQRQQRGPAR